MSVSRLRTTSWLKWPVKRFGLPLNIPKWFTGAIPSRAISELTASPYTDPVASNARSKDRQNASV